MKTVSFRHIPTIVGINVSAVEEKYNAVFMGDFCLRAKGGGWANAPAAVFWQAKPPVEGYSNYFALMFQGEQLYITSGASAFESDIAAIEGPDGEIIHSRYRHDFRSLKGGGGFIDGGRDYTRTGGDTLPKIVMLRAVGPMFEVLDPQ
jgi:hypothetical protein